MARERHQHKERKHRTFRDVHGRKWEGQVEKATGHPCGQIIPLFSAPLMPPQAYVAMDPNLPNRLVIDYDRWIADLRTHRATYRRHLEDIARELYGKDSHRYVDNPTPEMVRRIGSCPPLEPVVAAKQGKSRWILGLPGADGKPVKMPAWAEPFFKKPENRDAELVGLVFTDEDEPTEAEAEELELDDEADALPLGDTLIFEDEESEDGEEQEEKSDPLEGGFEEDADLPPPPGTEEGVIEIPRTRGRGRRAPAAE